MVAKDWYPDSPNIKIIKGTVGETDECDGGGVRDMFRVGEKWSLQAEAASVTTCVNTYEVPLPIYCKLMVPPILNIALSPFMCFCASSSVLFRAPLKRSTPTVTSGIWTARSRHDASLTVRTNTAL